ncbi:MAG: DNA-3-methyladenine glycosylase 2 family protein [Myxococcales bacterium]|nr:DNA-3-methyladenine glycosylase 2 family protein [Myxococcales bacterium]
MELDRAACRQAVVARDGRFDGRFVVAVATTGIYCRPVCPARTPRAERCEYFTLAAQAEAAGYRACLRCRPEVAPGHAASAVDARAHLVADAVALIERGFLIDRSQDELAAHLGVTARHLRRAVVAELGVTPGQLDRTRRFALAKQLLHDSRASVTAIALAAGFGSVRRWNAAFRAQFATTPSSFRRRAVAADATAALTVRLDARPPFDGGALLGFLAGRAIAGVEEVDGACYRRTVDDAWLEVRVVDDARRPGVRLTVAAALAPRLVPIVARVRALFDLDAEPAVIAAHLRRDPRLRAAVDAAPGRRVPGAYDPFEVAVRTVLGQQVSVAAASTLCGRLVARFGRPVATPFAALTHAAPTAAVLARASIDAVAEVGLPRARAATVIALAQAVVDGRVSWDRPRDPIAAMAALTALPGVGPWTASYLAMRALAWPDGFPAGDLVLQRQLGVTSRAAAEAASAAWRPWRAYAAMHLWAAAGARQGG